MNPLTGDMSSDIYVKSWVKGLEHDKQETDVHFNSLTGEGNFNWRFVFRFEYLPTEREVSVRRRPGRFALEEAEFRQPAVLVLQVWDYDRISANDFLGSLELQLLDMVRGARGPELCSVRLARDGAAPRCNVSLPPLAGLVAGSEAAGAGGRGAGTAGGSDRQEEEEEEERPVGRLRVLRLRRQRLPPHGKG